VQPTAQQLFTILSYALSTLQVLATQNGCGTIARAGSGRSRITSISYPSVILELLTLPHYLAVFNFCTLL